MSAGAVGLALGCGTAGQGQGDEADRNYYPYADWRRPANSTPPVSGCEEVLRPRSELPRCDGDTCAQVQRETDREVHWLLVMSVYERDAQGQERELSRDERTHELDCVMQQLEGLGLGPERLETPSPDSDDVTVNASFEKIESVLRTSAISAVELSCVETDCMRCETLSEQECRADAFCWAIDAARIAQGADCVESSYAGCYRGSPTCTDALVPTWGLDGACWLFANGCVPRAFSASSPDGTVCGYENFDALLSCEVRR